MMHTTYYYDCGHHEAILRVAGSFTSNEHCMVMEFGVAEIKRVVIPQVFVG